ncbi:MAG: RtcB family protein [Acidimicrobiales bacterium]
MPASQHGNVLSWASELDPQTLAQAQRTARLPIVAGPVALMPDAHIGLGATIGSVIPTEGAVIPAAVGVDIGCGMIAVETSLHAADLPGDLAPLHRRIAAVVPAGVGHGHREARADVFAEIGKPASDLTDRQIEKTYLQFGTLGSGNHFLEICLDENRGVWVVLHSGSRGVGNQLATMHIEVARGVCGEILEDRDLAYLVEGTPEFELYIGDMLWAQDYARANRAAMMDATLRELFDLVGSGHEVERVNCHHNFTEKERHLGREVWLTRKGAIRAEAGDRGVIPGSMGTRSYVVTGLGNPASYHSCSHGAGRRLSRTQARKQLDVDEFMRLMGTRAWDRDHALALIDEDPRAYKDIDQVMEDQRDLVRIDHTLSQILNYKGVEERRGRRRARARGRGGRRRP